MKDLTVLVELGDEGVAGASRAYGVEAVLQELLTDTTLSGISRGKYFRVEVTFQDASGHVELSIEAPLNAG